MLLKANLALDASHSTASSGKFHRLLTALVQLTFCVSLTFSRGGLLPKRLYEVYGESGTGKTQFAIQLLLSAVLPEQHNGLDGSALFVTAGKQLNDKRFAEMKGKSN